MGDWRQTRQSAETWFRGHSPREQIGLVAATALVLIAVFYYGIWAPVEAGLVRAQQDVVHAQTQARWLTNVSQQAKQLRVRAQNNDRKAIQGSLLSVLSDTLQSADLADAVTRMQPGNDNDVKVTFESVSFDHALRWLDGIHQAYGLKIHALTVSRRHQDSDTGIRMQVQIKRGQA